VVQRPELPEGAQRQCRVLSKNAMNAAEREARQRCGAMNQKL
jgi:hypothetical protein